MSAEIDKATGLPVTVVPAAAAGTAHDIKVVFLFRPHRGAYTGVELEPYLTGALPWPHAEPFALERACNVIAGSALDMIPGNFKRLDGDKRWSRYFLATRQQGGFDGTGIALVWNAKDGADAYRVAICQHRKVPHGTPNPTRGWHPGHCEACGIDLSVDSGD